MALNRRTNVHVAQRSASHVLVRTSTANNKQHTEGSGRSFFSPGAGSQQPTFTRFGCRYDLLEAEGSRSVTAPQPWARDTYFNMEDAEKMALLNIDAKVRDTRINGRQIRSFVEGVRDVGPARVFFFVRPELKDMVAASTDFAPANGHAGHPHSWKHKRFGAGNLQLSFSETTMPLPSDSTIRVHFRRR